MSLSLIKKLLMGKTLKDFNLAGDSFEIEEVVFVNDDKCEIEIKGTLLYYRSEDYSQRVEGETLVMPFGIPWQRLLEPTL